MKKLAKDVLKAWADQRRREILYEEIMHGNIMKPTLKK